MTKCPELEKILFGDTGVYIKKFRKFRGKWMLSSYVNLEKLLIASIIKLNLNTKFSGHHLFLDDCKKLITTFITDLLFFYFALVDKINLIFKIGDLKIALYAFLVGIMSYWSSPYMVFSMNVIMKHACLFLSVHLCYES